MKNNADLESYRKETERIMKKHNQVSIKSKQLHQDISDSMESKKERFDKKREAREKEFKFLRNK